MKLIKRAGQLAIILLLAIDGACGAKTNNGVSLIVNPNRPILIPTSSPPNGNLIITGPTAPYFYINSLTLSWTGATQFQLLTVSLYAASTGASGNGTATSFNCGGSGSTIGLIFSGTTFTDSPSGCATNAITQVAVSGANAIDSSGNLVMPRFTSSVKDCKVSVKSLGFYCDSLPVTVTINPYATYNIPVQVIVFGEGVDDNGNTTGRINTTTNITIQ